MIFIFLTAITLLFLLFTWKKRNSTMPTVLLLVSYIIVFTFRSMNVSDTEAYALIFNNVYDVGIEKGFTFVCNVLRGFGVSFRQFLFVIALFNITIWTLCTRKILQQNNLLMSLLFFMSYSGIYTYGIILRASMAESIMLVAITYMFLHYNIVYSKNVSKQYNVLKLFWKKLSFNIIILFTLLYLLTVLFHQTALIFFVILIVYFVPLNSKIRYIISVFSLLVFLFPNVTTIIANYLLLFISSNDLRFSGYLLEAGTLELGITQIIWVISAFFYIHCTNYILDENNRNKYIFILNIFIIGVFVTALLSFITAGVRVGMMLTFYEYLLPALLINYIIDTRKRRIVFMWTLFFVIANCSKIFTSLTTLIHYL